MTDKRFTFTDKEVIDYLMSRYHTKSYDSDVRNFELNIQPPGGGSLVCFTGHTLTEVAEKAATQFYFDYGALPFPDYPLPDWITGAPQKVDFEGIQRRSARKKKAS